MFDVPQFTKITVSEQAVEYIKGLIVQKKLLPGERLPSERDMSEQLGISRNTVREAYKMLATLGYVEIKHGQGVFIANETVSIDQWAASFFIRNDRIVELFEIRRVLETQSAQWAAEHATGEQIERLKEHVAYSYTLVESKDNEELLAKSDQEFHLMLARFSGNWILYRIMCNLIDLLKEIRKETMEIPGRLLKSVQEHERIVQAVADKDCGRSRAEMLNHLDSVRNALIREV